MIAMQYKIALPDTYDMHKIRKRVEENGCKTDGFQGLYFKAYLIRERKDSENGTNEYAPLYIWKKSEGMNTFIFRGFYDNILQSFGWQNLHVKVPYQIDIRPNFKHASYMVEIQYDIAKSDKMKLLHFSCSYEACVGSVLLYDPEHWTYTEYHFYKEKPEHIQGILYTILHISMG